MEKLLRNFTENSTTTYRESAPQALIDPNRSNPSFDYSVVGCSAIGSICFVSGICWLFYWICNKTRMPNETMKSRRHRKTSIISVSSGRSIQDPHAHHETMRNPHVYLDRSSARLSPIRKPIPTFSISSQFSPSAPLDSQQYPKHNQQYPNFFLQQQQAQQLAKQQLELEKPPPYNQGFSYSQVGKQKVPPPYSA